MANEEVLRQIAQAVNRYEMADIGWLTDTDGERSEVQPTDVGGLLTLVRTLQYAERTLATLAATLGCDVGEVQERVAALAAITGQFPWLSPHEIADRLRRVDAEYDAYSEGMYKSAKPLVEAVASLVVFVPPKPVPFQRSKRAPATPDAKE